MQDTLVCSLGWEDPRRRQRREWQPTSVFLPRVYHGQRNLAGCRTRVAKSWTEIWKDPDARKDWRREEKGTTEDEMVRWHRQLMDMSLSKLRELVMIMKAWPAAVHGDAKSGTQLSDWTNWTELNWAANTFNLTSCWLSQALFHQAGYLAWGSQPWCLLAVGKGQVLTIDEQGEGSQDGGRPSVFILTRSQMRPLPVCLSLEGAAAGRSDPCCYQITTFALSLHVHEILCAFTSHGQRSLVGCSPWGR